jgi:predicted RNA-binding Zn-ribbon protein involved in translation (DUF1610 family)
MKCPACNFEEKDFDPNCEGTFYEISNDIEMILREDMGSHVAKIYGCPECGNIFFRK